jgi:ribosome maturation factor RimP
MYSGHVNETVRAEIEPVLNGMGFSLVELAIGRIKRSTRVNVVIYRPSGVGIEECAEVSRLVYPRLETIEGLSEVSLEVSSPGIERVLKSPQEYNIFQGRGVRILEGTNTEWIGGVIEAAENGVLALKTGRELKKFPFSSIRKAKLDHSQENEGKSNAV